MPLRLKTLASIFLLSGLLFVTHPTHAQVIVTVAGTGNAGYSGDGGPATSANLNIPTSIAFDKSGNLLIADQQNAVIRKLDLTTGIITTIAGNGGQYHGGDGGPAISAGLYGPTGLAVDKTGNILIAEEYGSTIRKIDATTGIITTIAAVPGAGFNYSGDGGPAASASFYQPTGVVLDASGNIYIADWGNNVVREITAATGIINSVAGHYPGYAGYTGDGGPATLAELNACARISLDATGNLLIGDQGNNVIRQIDAPTGIIHTIIGTGANGYAGDGGPANKALLNQPSGVIMDASGIIYIADSYNDVIRMVDPATGIISTVAGNGIQGYSGDGGPPLNASFYRPVDLAVDAAGNLYVADARNNVIRKITVCPHLAPAITISQGAATLCTTNPIFTAVPTNGGSFPAYQWQINGVNTGTNSATYTASNVADGAAVTCILTSSMACATPATAVSNPITVTGALTATLIEKGTGCAGTDTLLVKASDPLAQITWYQGSTVVGTATAAPTLTGVTVAGNNGVGYSPGELNDPLGVYVDANGNVFVADNNNNRIQEWAPGATAGITAVGSASTLMNPEGLFIDAGGYIYVSDMGNNRIQKFPPGSTSATVGVTVAGGNGAGTAANQLNNPRAIFVDANGYLYVVDQYNERIQKFPPGSTSATPGVTVAGRPVALGDPIGIFVDGAGDMYVSEAGFNDVREWAPGATTGVIVAGGNGAGPAANQLNAPGNIFVDANGNIYIADETNNRVQKWAPGAANGVTAAGGNGAGTAANQLSYPEGVWVDGAGNVYASDLVKNSVQKWAPYPLIDTAYIATAPGSYTAALTGQSGCMTTTNAIDVKPTIASSVSISASTTTICAGTSVNFTATPSNGGSTPIYSWSVNGIGIGANSPDYTSNTLVNGDVIACALTSSATCATPATTNSNTIPMVVYSSLTPLVTVTADATTICAGDPVSFTASTGNGIADPVYQWQVNGVAVGGNSAGYESRTFSNGDVVLCEVTGNNGCAVGSSAGIVITVDPLPQIEAMPDIALSPGQTITLSPQVTGAINWYSWSPGAGLSDSTIPDPVANPIRTTLYTLTVKTAEGCMASATIKVGVYSNLRIPNAFTPNGDGKNDVFYVLGGPQGSSIRDLTVYNRWGQKIFQVHDGVPADPGFGWNGTYNGALAPPGTYVYSLTMRFADGTQQQLQGTVILVR